jgi:hypothetical protein
VFQILKNEKFEVMLEYGHIYLSELFPESSTEFLVRLDFKNGSAKICNEIQLTAYGLPILQCQ